MIGGSGNSTSAHSCVVVWDVPQAPENTTKMTTEVITVSFWPKISLNFDQTIKKPGSKSELMRKDVHQFISMSYRYTSTNMLSQFNYDVRKSSSQHRSVELYNQISNSTEYSLPLKEKVPDPKIKRHFQRRIDHIWVQAVP